MPSVHSAGCRLPLEDQTELRQRIGSSDNAQARPFATHEARVIASYGDDQDTPIGRCKVNVGQRRDFQNAPLPVGIHKPASKAVGAVRFPLRRQLSSSPVGIPSDKEIVRNLLTGF